MAPERAIAANLSADTLSAHVVSLKAPGLPADWKAALAYPANPSQKRTG